MLDCTWKRVGLMGLGLISTACGILGLFLPVLPSTVFFIIALWAFSKSSIRMHDWLFYHPRFGAHLRDWHAHGVIPRRAKILAVNMMALSWVIVVVASQGAWLVSSLVGITLACVATFILTRPSEAVTLPGEPVELATETS